MIENSEKLNKIIENILNEGCSFGNRLLYNMCVNIPGQDWNDEVVLADKIWLIGRSYAASPERRFSKKGEIKTKQGDGTGEYFYEIAKSIMRNQENDFFPNDDSCNDEYSFDFSNNDLELLKNAIEAVSNFNKKIKIASEAYDGGILDSEYYKNQVSFCSKFLHFHYPNSIFIIDSTVYEGAKYLWSTRSKSDAIISGEVCVKNKGVSAKEKGLYKIFNNPKYIDFENDITSFTETVCDCKKARDCIKEYGKHCLRAYMTGCLIKHCCKETPKSNYPRVIDTFLQKVKKL